MKATGIIRRIDELGRIVIPKELRRTLNITADDRIEIFTADDGVIALRKYEPSNSVLSYLERLEALIKNEEFRHKNKMLVKIEEMEALLKIEEQAK